MSPLVGITLGLDERGQLRPGRATHYLDTRYAAAVRRAGGTPIYLPPDDLSPSDLARDDLPPHERGPDPRRPETLPDAGSQPGVTAEAELAALVGRLDALLLPGGDDFLPARPYPPEVRFVPAAARQVAFDAALLRGARARGIPVLGICYGMQLLAREAGGRLLYDLPTDQPGAGEHQLASPEDRHTVEIRAGSRLAGILGPGSRSVNSRHHQGVAEPGSGLEVCARAPDGVIEALEAPGEAFVLGVQWHPESLEAEHCARLFGAFLAACGSA